MADNSHNPENNKRMEISQQQVSVVAATCLMLAFFVFIAGVFWGKKSILEISPAQLTSDSFADTIYDTFWMAPEERKIVPEQKSREELDSCSQLDKDSSNESESQINELNEQENEIQENQVKEELYYAQFGGFNTLQEAQNCSQKLVARGIQARPLERLSKTGAGEARIWYAVVTEATVNKNELALTINRIKRMLKVKITVNAINNEQKNMLFGKKGE